jgi:SM-20-related protein
MPDCLFLNIFAIDTCEQLVTELRPIHGAAAAVYGRETTGVVAPAIRKATRLIASPATRDRVLRRLLEQKSAIEEHFGQGLGEPEEPQFLRYEAGDYFVAHQDGNTPLVFDDSRFRKVSVIIFLNAQSEYATPGTYGGGSLVLYANYPNSDLRFPVAALPGTLVAFRSETTHEVTQVTHGERYVVVLWYALKQESRAGHPDSIPCPEAPIAGPSHAKIPDSALLARIIDFIRSLGIEVTEAEMHRATLVPGIDIQRGGLVVKEARMCKPADLLHEAAHIALTSANRRPALDGTITSSPAEEMAAIAWTWAAAKHLQIDPGEVFHQEVISGNGPALLENFSGGHYVGVPMLQYWRMTREKPGPADDGEPYPHMTRWMRDD